MKKLFSLAAVTAVLALPAAAQTWSSNAPNIGPVNQPEGIYIKAYPVSTNYCPAGYQPVVVGGTISCGTPNAGASPSSGTHGSSSGTSCPAGSKGCS